MKSVDHIEGHTWHGRKGAIENGFRYSIDYVMLDPERPVRGPRLFSRNAANVFSLQDRDHGGAPKDGEGAAWARRALSDNGIELDGDLVLLTQPRVLGHVFNPVSFWLCHDSAGVLRAVIAEVTNTFGQRHSYLCHNDDLSPITPSDKLVARKIFHVSPFQPIAGVYHFRFDIREDRIGIWIDLTHDEGGLTATLTGPRQPLTNTSILRSLFRRPFGARRVVVLIFWQALKLKVKRAFYRPCPDGPETEVSR